LTILKDLSRGFEPKTGAPEICAQHGNKYRPAPALSGPSPDRPQVAIGEAGRAAPIFFGFGWHKALLPRRWIAIPRSGEGPSNVRSGSESGRSLDEA